MGVAKFQHVERMLGKSQFKRPGAAAGLKGGIILTGDDVIDRKLATMLPRIQKKLVRKGTRKAAKDIVLPDAKRMAPIDTGALERSMTVRAIPRSRVRIGHMVTTKDNRRGAGAFRGDFFYGFFHEFGTVKMAADPFMRPALYSNENRIRRAFEDALLSAIKDEEVKQLAEIPF